MVVDDISTLTFLTKTVCYEENSWDSVQSQTSSICCIYTFIEIDNNYETGYPTGYRRLGGDGLMITFHVGRSYPGVG
jgi:hypothetical protein